jgi:hypothetical protein
MHLIDIEKGKLGAVNLFSDKLSKLSFELLQQQKFNSARHNDRFSARPCENSNDSQPG